MDKILQKIANLLILNLQNCENNGLIKGKMGIAVFLYHYSRYASQPVYNKQADDLLDEIFAMLEMIVTPSLSDGVAGIGLGLNHLIENHFIATNEKRDELFKDVDVKLSQDYSGQFTFDTKTNFPVFSAGFYALSRLKTGSRSIQKNKLVSSLLEGLDLIYTINKLTLNPMFINSAIHFLIGVYDCGMYKQKAERTMKKFLSFVLATFPEMKYHFSDVEIMQNTLSSTKLCPALTGEILSRIKQLDISPSNTDDMDVVIKDLQQYTLYPNLDKTSLSQFSVEEYIDKQITDSFFPDLSSLTYIGLNIIGVKLC